MTKRILVIEHDRSFFNRIRDFFSPELQCVFADTRQEALSLLQNKKFDIIILSAELHEVSGYLLCKTIKENTLFQSIPLIIVSEASDAAVTFEQHKKLKFHADAYVEKKVSNDSLLKIMYSFIPSLEHAEKMPEIKESIKDLEQELVQQKKVNEMLLRKLNEYREECSFLRKKVNRVDEQLEIYSPKKSIVRFRDHFKSHDDALLELEKKDREIQNLFDTVTSLRDEMKKSKETVRSETEVRETQHKQVLDQLELDYKNKLEKFEERERKFREIQKKYREATEEFFDKVDELRK